MRRALLDRVTTVRSRSPFFSDEPNGSSARFDAVLASQDGAARCIAPRALAAALVVVTLAASALLFGADASLAVAAIATLVLLPWALAPAFARRRVTERVSVENGVVRISRFVGGRLIDQRRFKLDELDVDSHGDGRSHCERIELRSQDRTFEIARHLTPGERSRFVESLLEALRLAGVEPRLRQTADPPSEPRERASASAAERLRCGERRVLAARLRRGEFWAIAALAATLSVVPALQTSSRSSDAVTAPRVVEPSFRLTTTGGETIDDRALIGRPYAVFFGFTKCPEACPTTLLELTRALEEIGSAASRFDVYFVTLDPERDTPKVLADYLSSFGLRVHGLTGTRAEVERAAQAFRVYHRRAPLDGGGYTIDHTTLVYLIDSRGRLADAVSFAERGDLASKRLRVLISGASSDAASTRFAARGGKAKITTR